MAKLTILYWRDIPSQVVAKAGRKSAKILLSERFQEAIDMAAMRGDKSETDDYLAEWRRGEPADCGDDLEAEAQNCAQGLEDKFNKEVLVALVKNHGKKP
jgi:hypothetical protein